MYTLQGLLAAVFFATQVAALISCNVTSYNTTVTVATTITPIVTLFTTLNSTDVMATSSQSTFTVTVTLSCPKLAARRAESEPFDSSQISTVTSRKYHGPPALVKTKTLNPSAESSGKPFPNFTNQPMAYNIVATTPAAPAANCNAGVLGFFPAMNCSSSAQVS